MTLKLNGSSAGSVSIDAPADTSPSGSDISFTLPTADGSSGQVIQTNGSGVLSFGDKTTDTGDLQTFTAVNLSGGSQEFTGIPSDAYRIIIAFQNLSFNTTSILEVNLGTGTGPTWTTSGYYFARGQFGSSSSTGERNNNTEFSNASWTGAGDTQAGQIVLAKSNDNIWTFQLFLHEEGDANLGVSIGYVNLSEALSAIKIEGSAGSFDGGNASIWYMS